jgi:hypothetical protein
MSSPRTHARKLGVVRAARNHRRVIARCCPPVSARRDLSGVQALWVTLCAELRGACMPKAMHAHTTRTHTCTHNSQSCKLTPLPARLASATTAHHHQHEHATHVAPSHAVEHTSHALMSLLHGPAQGLLWRADGSRCCASHPRRPAVRLLSRQQAAGSAGHSCSWCGARSQLRGSELVCRPHGLGHVLLPVAAAGGRAAQANVDHVRCHVGAQHLADRADVLERREQPGCGVCVCVC